MAGKPPVKGARLLKLAGMTASVASGYATSKVKSLIQSKEAREEEERSFRKQSGERIAQTLGELKGAAMKVGQFASAAKDLFPEEVADALGKLQREAPPMDWEVIEAQIQSELGDAPEVLFRSFDQTPYAAASVGQVHRAVTDDGRQVVVKVQYPGVDDAVDSDLTQVKLALRIGGLVQIERELLDAVFEEMRARLHEELDYCNEADNVREFREFHAQHDFIVVPDVVGERSSKRVLTLEYEPGKHFRELEGPDVPQIKRDLVATNVGLMIVTQLFELQAIHGDPNPANFAWRDDGTLVLYDFGCVKRFQPETIEAIRELLVAARARDYAGLDAAMINLGPLRPKYAPVPPTFYDKWLHALAPPLYTKGPFDFGKHDLSKRVMKVIPTTVAHQHWWKPAPDLAILDRTIAGHYDSARNIQARVPVRHLIEKFLPPE